jgi:hypothetical protein
MPLQRRSQHRAAAIMGQVPQPTRVVVAAVASMMLAHCAPAVNADAQPTVPQAPTPPGGPAVPVTLTIDRFAPGATVPPRFLGLSFEASALGQIGQYAHRGDLVGLLRSLGPGVLRFGGITADENVGWTDAATPQPAWASSAIGAPQLHAIGELARGSDWRVLLTVGMAHYEPQAAAREVAAAHSALGPYLAAVEIGNEPNAYGAHGFRELPWLAQGYEEQVSAYREAIDALTPGVPIAGPDVSGSGAFSEWGEEEAIAQSPAMLTGHHYPLGCAQTPPPSIEALLSSETRGLQERSLADYMRVANRHRIPLRIDETNSVSCGGVAGISNTFASALWATGYITQAMAAGTAGINLEGNPSNCAGYTPVCAPAATALAEGTLRAQPDWYALLLTRSLVGTRPLPVTISAAGSPKQGGSPTIEGSPAPEASTNLESSPNLVAAAFLTPNHSVKVVLVDDEPQSAAPLQLSLNVGAGMGAASVMRLTAQSPSATEGVTLAGRAVALDGSWRPPTREESFPSSAGVATLELDPSSAALVTVNRRQPPRAGHHPTTAHRRSRR